MCKFSGLVSSHSIWNAIFLKLQVTTVQTLNCCYLKFEKNYFRIGGEDTSPLKNVAIVFKFSVSKGILACLKNQVENHSKTDNSVNNQKSETFKSNFSKSWKENRESMLYIMRQTSLFSLLNLIINIVGSRVSNLILFLSWYDLVKFRNIKKKLGI